MNDLALLITVHLRVWKPISIGSPPSFGKDNWNNCGRFVELYAVERARLFVNADTHACSRLYAASKLPWYNRDYCPWDRRLRGSQSPSGHSGVKFWSSQESNPISRQRCLSLRHPGLL